MQHCGGTLWYNKVWWTLQRNLLIWSCFYMKSVGGHLCITWQTDVRTSLCLRQASTSRFLRRPAASHLCLCMIYHSQIYGILKAKGVSNWHPSWKSQHLLKNYFNHFHLSSLSHNGLFHFTSTEVFESFLTAVRSAAETSGNINESKNPLVAEMNKF